VPSIDSKAIEQILAAAHAEGRTRLYEYEIDGVRCVPSMTPDGVSIHSRTNLRKGDSPFFETQTEPSESSASGSA
jgi:hypothetical protein